MRTRRQERREERKSFGPRGDALRYQVIADAQFLTHRPVESATTRCWRLGLANAADVNKWVKTALMLFAAEAASPVS